jgi:flagellar hook-basal body complex protein FliE
MTPLLPVVASILPVATDFAKNQASGAGAHGAGSDASSFTQTLARAANDAASALGEAETAAIRGVQGSASIQEVATKVMAAERAVQTAIALRDRFVASLQEISRMQV